ncbi:hypothetical protein GWK47_009533 [Chionoecetes opilio]|uniref:Uncharacterized protein n=1 Tax=Chionoecetes opilio TaxID=41210 RepID=A0A8J5C3T9_CHIOP|nr:hypothetical protein GWK47_009533 [Chionoecetes opilio]
MTKPSQSAALHPFNHPRGLREMLNIASQSGSLPPPRTSAVDAGTQTVEDSPKGEEDKDSSQDVQVEVEVEDQSPPIDTHKTSVS